MNFISRRKMIKKQVIAVFLLLGMSLSSNTMAQTTEFKWNQTDSTLSLMQQEKVLWQLNFDKEKDKPYFHPLRTLKGYDLTMGRPADHPWHRGLWFSWKDINGVNYWEESAKTGLSVGRSKIQSVEIKKNPDFSAQILLHLMYSDSTGQVLKEERELLVSAPSSVKVGYNVITRHKFTALQPVVLDLEKPAIHGGVSHGGYAGLGFRGSPDLEQAVFSASSGWSGTKDTTGYGTKEKWMNMTAKANKTTTDLVGITIYDHPSNPRSPTPWYIWYAAGRNLFFMPSLLFDGPMKLTKGEELNLVYKVWIHDGKRNKKEQKDQYIKFN